MGKIGRVLNRRSCGLQAFVIVQVYKRDVAQYAFVMRITQYYSTIGRGRPNDELIAWEPQRSETY